MSAPGRPKREYRSAQHEGSPKRAMSSTHQGFLRDIEVSAGLLSMTDPFFARVPARSARD